MAEYGRKQVFDDTYLHNLLFHTQICSKGQRVVFNYPMVSPKVPTTLMTPHSYLMGHDRHSFVSQNGPIGWKQVLTILTTITSFSTHKYVLWANKGCSIILWYHPRCLLHSWSNIVTIWANIATHLWPKMAENGWKQVFDDTYLHNHLFHTQICSKGQRVVFNYSMVSPKVPTTLII
jgi:hypothetical protein